MCRHGLRKKVKSGAGERVSPRSFDVVMILFLIQAIVVIPGILYLFHPRVLRVTVEVEDLGQEQERM